MITTRYLARAYLVATVAALVALSTLFLILDFTDRVKFYGGAGWLPAVLQLYACKLAQVVWQLAPAAAGFGGAIAMSGLRRTGEITAFRALGRGPVTFALPVAAVALALGGALFLAEDPVIVPARAKAEEISVLRFHRWGDWGTYHSARRWFRGKNGRLYHVGRPAGRGFSGVTILDLTPDFRLARRIDARRMEPQGARQWKLFDATVRSFGPAGAPMREREVKELVEPFSGDTRLFRVEPGRPDEIRRSDLPRQIALRRKLGLPSREFQLSLYDREGYQLAGVPAALIGLALALRKKRRGHLTAAISEGFVITIGLWGLSAISHTLALGGHLSPVVAGWLPFAVTSLVAASALRLVR